MTPVSFCENVIEVRSNISIELLTRHVATIESRFLICNSLFVVHPICWVIASLIWMNQIARGQFLLLKFVFLLQLIDKHLESTDLVVSSA